MRDIEALGARKHGRFLRGRLVMGTASGMFLLGALCTAQTEMIHPVAMIVGTTGGPSPEGQYENPSCDPIDGRWIAFEVSGWSNRSQFLMDIAVGELVQVTPPVQGTVRRGLEPQVSSREGSFVGQLSWCPVRLGGKVWFAVAAAVEGNMDVYVGNTADTGRLLRVTDDEGVDDQPAWSPDGIRLAFVSRRTGSGDVYVIGNLPDLIDRLSKLGWARFAAERLDGWQWLERVTTDARVEVYPCWMPDGEAILYSALGGAGDTALSELLCRSMGSDRVISLLHDGEKILRNVSVSPDGSMMAYYCAAGKSDDEPCNLAVADLLYDAGALAGASVRWTAGQVRRFEHVRDRPHGGPLWSAGGSLLFVNANTPSAIQEIRYDALRGAAAPMVREHRMFPGRDRRADFSVSGIALQPPDEEEQTFVLTAQHGERHALYAERRPAPDESARKDSGSPHTDDH